MILLDGVPLGRAGLAWPRPDVAEAHGDPRRGLCGFDRVVTLPPALRTPGPHTVAIEARLLDGRSRRTTPVQVDFPARALAAGRGRRSPAAAPGGGPIHSVWLARSLDQGGSQLRMAETVEHLARRGWIDDRAVPEPRARCAPRSRRPAPRSGSSRRCRSTTSRRYRAAVSRLVGELDGRRPGGGADGHVVPARARGGLAGVPAVQRIGEEAPLPTVAAWLMGQLDAEVEAYARRAITRRGRDLDQRARRRGELPRAGLRRRLVRDPHRSTRRRRPAFARRGPAAARAARRTGELLVCAGTIWPVKGQGLLAEAARIVREDHPELLVAMVGYDGNPYAAALRAHVAAHDLTDTVLVAPFHDDLGTWWAAADAVALTPHSPSEALSGALVEGDGPRPARAGHPGG